MYSQSSNSIISALLIALMCTACVSESPAAAESALSPSEVFTEIVERGLSCELQGRILSFDEAQHEELAHLFLLSELTIEQRATLVDTREGACNSTSTEVVSGGIGVRTEAISGTWVAVPIPEGTTSGNLANSVFTDSSSSSWMCNSGSPESPADFVVQFHFQGAYYNRNSLELQGQNWWVSCYLGSTNASRVYDDDDVRTCVGYWTTILCGGTPPITSDIAIGL